MKIKPEKIYYRIIAAFMMVMLNYLGILGVSITTSYFNDAETSIGNIYQSTVVDLEAEIDLAIDDTIKPTTVLWRTISLHNTGNIGFDYNGLAANFSGDTLLCDVVAVSVAQGADILYQGPLTGLSIATSSLATGTEEQYNITFTLDTNDSSLGDKACNFDIDFYAWHTSQGSYDSLYGFTDIETISGVLESQMWGVVLNEFLPDPIGQDHARMPAGEWIELYNNNLYDVDVAGWMLYDAHDSHELSITASTTNTGDTVVPAQGWLVAYRDGDNDFSLDNNGDTLRLYDGPIGSGSLVDQYTYDEGKDEGYTHARIPDGIGGWVDPLPTPGAANQLADIEKAEEAAGETEEINIDDISEGAGPEIEPPVVVVVDTDVLNTTADTSDDLTVAGEDAETDSPSDEAVPAVTTPDVENSSEPAGSSDSGAETEEDANVEITDDEPVINEEEAVMAGSEDRAVDNTPDNTPEEEVVIVAANEQPVDIIEIPVEVVLLDNPEENNALVTIINEEPNTDE